MSGNQSIPFLDLVSLHAELKDELMAVFSSALDTAGFIGGPMVQRFEEDFARFCETEHCVGVGSGTDALRFALIAAGVGMGDGVVTVPNTFIATTEAISQSGARPFFVDIDERTYNMDPEKLREFLACCDFDGKTLRDRATNRRIAAVVPVHLYGQMADMDPIVELAEKYNLTVIEDACQAHGAEYFSRKANRWRKAGSIGKAAAFSFYPGKNLGACGEAGAITTNDPDMVRTMRMLRDHGQSKKYYHDIEGYNGRLDAVQAGILRVKLRHLPEWTEQRRECARTYDRLFAEAGGAMASPSVPDGSRPVYHLYVIRVRDRERIQKHLGEAGIGTGIHYPIPLHLLTAYEVLGYQRGNFPVAERAASEVLSLPMFPGLTTAGLDRVVQAVLQAAGNAISATAV